ncbi:MAG: hypothetical protein ACYC3X_24900 [Pirellulaceae bacterium]
MQDRAILAYHRVRNRLAATHSVWTVLVLATVAHADTTTWPQWRGPQRDAQYRGAPWPDSLQEDHLAKSWRVELAPSYSGPIVATDRVFVTKTLDRKTEIVRALDERGELLLIHASPDQFDLLDRRTIADDAWAHLALCGQEVFVRELTGLTALLWKYDRRLRTFCLGKSLRLPTLS